VPAGRLGRQDETSKQFEWDCHVASLLAMTKKKMTILLVIILLLFFSVGCTNKTKNTPENLAPKTIRKDTTWSGKVTVDGLLTIVSGVTLYIKPGTIVEFTKRDKKGDDTKGSRIYSRGRIVAKGTKKKPIFFTSKAKKRGKGDWGEIKIEYSQGGSLFEYAVVEYGFWGVHAHFTRLTVRKSIFRNNTGGLRFRSGPVYLKDSLFTNNNTGVRFLIGKPTIEYNNMIKNRTGLFLTQQVETSNIRFNNIEDNLEYDLQLGWMQDTDVYIPKNWWGTSDVAEIKKKTFDKSRDTDLGKAFFEPVLKKQVKVYEWVPKL